MNIPQIPYKYNITVLRGTDYSFAVKLQNCDGSQVSLRHFNVKMQIRKGYSSEALDELTQKNGRILISSSQDNDFLDTVTIILDHEHTKNYPFGGLLYDLRIESGNNAFTKILEGQILCRVSVTQ